MRFFSLSPIFLAVALTALAPLPAAAQKVERRICEASADIVTSVAEMRRSGMRKSKAEKTALDGLSEEFQVLRPAVYIIVEDVYSWTQEQLDGYSRQDWLDQCTASR